MPSVVCVYIAACIIYTDDLMAWHTICKMLLLAQWLSIYILQSTCSMAIGYCLSYSYVHVCLQYWWNNNNNYSMWKTYWLKLITAHITAVEQNIYVRRIRTSMHSKHWTERLLCWFCRIIQINCRHLFEYGMV